MVECFADRNHSCAVPLLYGRLSRFRVAFLEGRSSNDFTKHVGSSKVPELVDSELLRHAKRAHVQVCLAGRDTLAVVGKQVIVAAFVGLQFLDDVYGPLHGRIARIQGSSLAGTFLTCVIEVCALSIDFDVLSQQGAQTVSRFACFGFVIEATDSSQSSVSRFDQSSQDLLFGPVLGQISSPLPSEFGHVLSSLFDGCKTLDLVVVYKVEGAPCLRATDTTDTYRRTHIGVVFLGIVVGVHDNRTDDRTAD